MKNLMIPRMARLATYALTLTLASSCAQNDRDNCVTYDVTADNPATGISTRQKRKTEPQSRLTGSSADKNSEPYKLGRKHARILHENCRTTEAIRDELLDINARTTNIQCRIGADAANDYLHGIKDYLTECGDTLANVLF